MSDSAGRKRPSRGRADGDGTVLSDKGMAGQSIMTTTVKLDELDLDILRHLNQDARKIAKDERVTHVYDVTGEWDSIVVVRLRNTRDLDAFIKRLGSMEYVDNTYTQVVLNVVKEERRVLM